MHTTISFHLYVMAPYWSSGGPNAVIQSPKQPSSDTQMNILRPHLAIQIGHLRVI